MCNYIKYIFINIYIYKRKYVYVYVYIYLLRRTKAEDETHFLKKKILEIFQIVNLEKKIYIYSVLISNYLLI